MEEIPRLSKTSSSQKSLSTKFWTRFVHSNEWEPSYVAPGQASTFSGPSTKFICNLPDSKSSTLKNKSYYSNASIRSIVALLIATIDTLANSWPTCLVHSTKYWLVKMEYTKHSKHKFISLTTPKVISPVISSWSVWLMATMSTT